MDLDPEVIPILEFLRSEGFPDPRTASVEELREAAAFPPPAEPTAVDGVENLTIPGPAGALPLRIYRPAAAAPAPLLVFFHGGGWVVGDLDSHDETVRQLCAGSGAVVVSVAYRLAPETPFPGGLEDCYRATAWAAAEAQALGADGARLAVGGDSAGGNLAAATCLLARDRGGPRIRHQLLVYPVTDRDFDRASYRHYGEDLFLTADMMRWFWDQYLPAPDHGTEPLATPLHGDLRGLPGATIITAGCDPLRDEGKAYAERLQAAGVATAYREFAGMIHGFLGMTEALTQARAAMGYACERLAEALSA